MKPMPVALLMLLSMFSLPARAAYSAATVKGSYSFLLNEWTTTSGTNSSTIGVLTFDGVSEVSGGILQVTNTSRQQFNIESGSTYSVERNGTGSLNLVTSSGTLPFSIVLSSVSGGVAQQFQLLLLNPTGANTVTAGTAVAVNLSSAGSAANLKGTYSVLINLWQANPNLPMIGAVGSATFDGVGSVTLSYTQEVGGVSSTQTVTGTYSVATDGSGTMVFGSGAAAVTFDFAINNVRKSIARGLQFLNGGGDGGNNIVSTATAILQQ
jgi:hypothetical protein